MAIACKVIPAPPVLDAQIREARRHEWHREHRHRDPTTFRGREPSFSQGMEGARAHLAFALDIECRAAARKGQLCQQVKPSVGLAPDGLDPPIVQPRYCPQQLLEL